MSLLKDLLSVGAIKNAQILADSDYFENECVTTELPVLNIAFSGDINGGLVPGITILAGLSKSFKTLLGLYCMKSYLAKYPDSIALFYDSERGANKGYLEKFGIDASRVGILEVEHIEQLKFDLSKKLESIKDGTKVFIFIDSLGTMASKKEVEDALDAKAVADMTRAKAIRSFLRVISPYLNIKRLPCVIVNHVYNTMELYSKTVVGGGTAVTYNAQQIFMISRSQEKDKDDNIEGYKFTITVDKSRLVRERAKLPFTVLYEGGIQKWSGLFDIALELGFIQMPTKGWYCTQVNPDTKFRKADYENDDDFWNGMLEGTDFADAVKQYFSLSSDYSKELIDE